MQLDPEDYVPEEINGEIEAMFTGRELLLSTIKEKCYHNEIKTIIENNKKDE